MSIGIVAQPDPQRLVGVGHVFLKREAKYTFAIDGCLPFQEAENLGVALLKSLLGHASFSYQNAFKRVSRVR